MRRLRSQSARGPLDWVTAPGTESPQQRLARYTPERLRPAHWALARPAGRAVLDARPRSADDAKAVMSKLCQLLAGHAGWDRTTPPDLVRLVTPDAIEAQLKRLDLAGKSDKTLANQRASPRRLARAVGKTDVGSPGAAAPRPTRDALASAATGRRPNALRSDASLLAGCSGARASVRPPSRRSRTAIDRSTAVASTRLLRPCWRRVHGRRTPARSPHWAPSAPLHGER